jgi:hypothetical protein
VTYASKILNTGLVTTILTESDQIEKLTPEVGRSVETKTSRRGDPCGRPSYNPFLGRDKPCPYRTECRTNIIPDFPKLVSFKFSPAVMPDSETNHLPAYPQILPKQHDGHRGRVFKQTFLPRATSKAWYSLNTTRSGAIWRMNKSW